MSTVMVIGAEERTVREERLGPGKVILSVILPVQKTAWAVEESVSKIAETEASFLSSWIPVGLDPVRREEKASEETARNVV